MQEIDDTGQSEALSARVRAFYSYPGYEEMDIESFCLQFGCTETQARNMIHRLTREKFLVRRVVWVRREE